jgi:hypothetical protein
MMGHHSIFVKRCTRLCAKKDDKRPLCHWLQWMPLLWAIHHLLCFFDSTSIIWQCWKEKNCVLDTKLAIMLFFTLFNNIVKITSTINNSWISQSIAKKCFVIGGARLVATRSHSNWVIMRCPCQSHSLVGHDSKLQDTTFHLFWEMSQVLQ